MSGTPKPAVLGAPVSTRELDVLRLVAQGNSNAEIGAALFTTENTIKAHLTRLSAKLGSRNRTHMVALAMERGWLPPVAPETPCGLRIVCLLPLGHAGAHIAGVAQ